MESIPYVHPARRLSGGVLALAAALVLSACVSASEPAAPTAPPTVTPPPATTAPDATPTPDLQSLLRDGGIAMIEVAYHRLLDEYITQPEPSTLLAGAWAAMSREASGLGVSAPPQPAFSGGRIAAWAAFRGAYVPFAASVPDATKLRYGAITGMTQTLQDCHTFFLGPVASDTLLDTRAGKGSVGIGVELAGIPPLITEVVTGSPAATASFAVGDRVVGVGGVDTSGLGPAGALDLLNGEEGTTVDVTVRRPDGSTLDAPIRRERVTPPNIESRVLAGGIGYVRVRNFIDGGIVASLRSALDAFEAQGVRAWIIDIRGNPGGRLDYEALSLFIKSGVTARDRNRDGVVHEDVSSGMTFPALKPTVVLTNNRTGSVAEVFAVALQEYDVADLVGATTNGCVGYTEIHELGDGSSLAVTTHVNLGPVSWKQLNSVGVVPDIQVPRTSDDIANGRDPQLDAAIAHLTP